MVVQARVADRYEIKELLGQGGMGVVYRALDIKTKSDVALKTMRDASDPTAVEMFEKEWALLAGLCHPNIVDIRDVGEIEDNGQKKPFFVMPLLRGATLAHLIEDSSARLTVERVVGIITQVCRGLQIAHDRGLIHRDIKPSNIFVMEDDTAKIIDFGVVHLAGTHSVTGHKGTWQYMAPEQVDLKPATPASDLFSIGVVCYETLTGKKPFARSTPVQTAEALRTYIPPPASELNPAVTQLLSMVVHKAMAKEPIHRFVNARDLGESLQKAFLNQPIERFDPARIQPRIDRAKKALAEGDEGFAAEILGGLEAEGNIGLEITLLRGQIQQRTKQKKIRQLLESARTRVEQDEIPLALEKIQEVLSIDQENSDALALRSTVEKQRNERQIESWMGLARKHLDRHDFAEARQALREVLRIRPSDTTAGDLLAETDRREQQSLRIRSEREQLYGSAMLAYQNGEMSSALSKLERLLELGSQTPDAAVPERDAAYQVFYNQVRTERDAIQNGYGALWGRLIQAVEGRILVQSGGLPGAGGHRGEDARGAGGHRNRLRVRQNAVEFNLHHRLGLARNFKRRDGGDLPGRSVDHGSGDAVENNLHACQRCGEVCAVRSQLAGCPAAWAQIRSVEGQQLAGRNRAASIAGRIHDSSCRNQGSRGARIRNRVRVSRSRGAELKISGVVVGFNAAISKPLCAKRGVELAKRCTVRRACAIAKQVRHIQNCGPSHTDGRRASY